MDNARVHRAKWVTQFMLANRLTNAPHPPYSPDLAPSDFYLFGKLKHLIIGKEFAGPDDLINWINAEFMKIPKSELNEVFLEWMKRLEKCIHNKGEYIE